MSHSDNYTDEEICLINRVIIVALCMTLLQNIGLYIDIYLSARHVQPATLLISMLPAYTLVVVSSKLEHARLLYQYVRRILVNF